MAESLDEVLIEAYRRGYKARQQERDYDPGEATDLAEGWLAAHDAQQRAEAWDEGYREAEGNAMASLRAGARIVTDNPYRAAETEATR